MGGVGGQLAIARLRGWLDCSVLVDFEHSGPAPRGVLGRARGTDASVARV